MKHLKWIIPVLIIIFCFLGFLIAPHDPEAMDIVNKYGTTADLFAAPHKEWTKEFVRLAMVEEGGGWTWQKSKSEM